MTCRLDSVDHLFATGLRERIRLVAQPAAGSPAAFRLPAVATALATLDSNIKQWETMAAASPPAPAAAEPEVPSNGRVHSGAGVASGDDRPFLVKGELSAVAAVRQRLPCVPPAHTHTDTQHTQTHSA